MRRKKRKIGVGGALVSFAVYFTAMLAGLVYVSSEMLEVARAEGAELRELTRRYFAEAPKVELPEKWKRRLAEERGDILTVRYPLQMAKALLKFATEDCRIQNRVVKKLLLKNGLQQEDPPDVIAFNVPRITETKTSWY